jgi:indolepyruvate ferredoxin oxidoreductase
MAPPVLGRKDPVTGAPRKSEFGAWMLPALRGLAKLKVLRGGPLDPFGRSAERRRERAHAEEAIAACGLVARRLSAETREACAELLALPLEAKGYGHVKARNMDRIEPRMRELAAALAG